ncbi:MAG: MTAP family purine nucleoside phosphorylase [Candidatus Hodarchaeales archaeon]
MVTKDRLKKICFIGGSGFYELLTDSSEIAIETPFDSKPVKVLHQMKNGIDTYFLPRHGSGHSIPPHKVNYHANIYALHSLGITRVIATSAVGSLRVSYQPGDYVILDQFIDFVRPLTFFNGDFGVDFPSGAQLSGVVHVDMTSPYCSEIREAFSQVLKEDSRTHMKGTYAITNGPRFETAAEIKALEMLGADVVGMTNSSETVLCRELGICYCTIAVVTNMAAGLQKEVNHQEVLDIFNSRSSQLKQIFSEIINHIPFKRVCTCANHVK